MKPVPKVFTTKKDILFLLFLVFLSFFAWSAHYFSGSSSPTSYQIIIFTEPKQILTFKSVPEQPVKVEGKLGPAIIEWNQNGEFHIASSTCPLHLCTNYGWSKGPGIVCVPNGIVVKGLKKQEKYDAVSR
jgi:hypothetical protein